MSDPEPTPALPPSAWGVPPEKPSPGGPFLFAILLGVLLIVGFLTLFRGCGDSVGSGPADAPVSAPSGRAQVVPPAPPNKTLYLVPLDGTSEADIAELARFYGERYGITVKSLSAVAIKPQAFDAGRNQFVGEDALAAMAVAFQAPLADPAAVIIGVADGDLYLRSRPDWGWAFGIRSGDGRLAVVATYRMTLLGGGDSSRRMSRLRKMVGKDIGLMYYGLATSADPSSMLYGNILGVDDLDRMGEEF
jgi:predicted Zn-dependent protease